MALQPATTLPKLLTKHSIPQPFIPPDRFKPRTPSFIIPPDRFILKSTPHSPDVFIPPDRSLITPAPTPTQSTTPAIAQPFIPPDRVLTAPPPPPPPSTTPPIIPPSTEPPKTAGFVPPDRVLKSTSPADISTTMIATSPTSPTPRLQVFLQPETVSSSTNTINLTESIQPSIVTTTFHNATDVSIFDMHNTSQTDTPITTTVLDFGSSFLNNTSASTNHNLPSLTSTTVLKNLTSAKDLHMLTSQNSRVCGFLPFCEDTAYDACYNTTISSCNQCSKSGAGLFLFFIIVLGLCIFIGNTIVICVGEFRRRKGKLNKMDICRSSLAAADILAGIQILVVVIGNFAWTYNSTALEIDQQQLKYRGSVEAFFGSFLYLLCYTASIYHLFYMGLMRVYAIVKPIRFKWQSLSAVYISVGIVWILSITAATTSAWSPTALTYSYFVPIYLFLPSIKQITLNQSYTPAIALLIVFFVIPYILMTLVTITSVVVIAISFKNKSRRLNANNHSGTNNTIDSQKVRVFVTVAIMQLGFTITLIPVAVVVILIYAGQLNCSNFSVPYAICFYLSMSNSLVNVIIYSFRDKAFRTSVKEIFSQCFSRSTYFIKPSTTKSSNLAKDKSVTSDNSNAAKTQSSKTTTFSSEGN